MATSASLRARQDAIVALYHEEAELVRDVQRRAVAELLPALKEGLDLDEDGVGAGRALLEDKGTLQSPSSYSETHLTPFSHLIQSPFFDSAVAPASLPPPPSSSCTPPYSGASLPSKPSPPRTSPRFS
jgi:hypothetical protein